MKKSIIHTLMLAILMCNVCYANSIEDAKDRAYTATITDAFTTIIALSKGATDYNPIVGSNVGGVIPVTIFKFVVIDAIASSNDTTNVKQNQLNFATAVWGGASINNFFVLAGVTNPASLILGAIGGYIIYDTINKNIDE